MILRISSRLESAQGRVGQAVMGTANAGKANARAQRSAEELRDGDSQELLNCDGLRRTGHWCRLRDSNPPTSLITNEVIQRFRLPHFVSVPPTRYSNHLTTDSERRTRFKLLFQSRKRPAAFPLCLPGDEVRPRCSRSPLSKDQARRQAGRDSRRRPPGLYLIVQPTGRKSWRPAIVSESARRS